MSKTAVPAATRRKARYKYQSLAHQLHNEILDGRYPPGVKLPSERQLASQWQVTPMTVRQALGSLETQGLIERFRGRGTFVAEPREPHAEVADLSLAPIYLLGLSPAAANRGQVNWQTRLRRFQGIVEGVFQHRLRLVCDPDLTAETSVKKLIARLRQASGLILHEAVLPEAVVVGLAESGVPVVAIDCYREIGSCSHVQVDQRRGAFLAVDHLASLGHRRIGMICGSPQVPGHACRLAGYRDGLALGELAADESLLVIEPEGDLESAAAAARRLLGVTPRPTAIFTGSDTRAIAVLNVAAALGISVPGELAVVGFDNIHETVTTTPPLTTVSNPLTESGTAAVAILGRQIRSGQVSPEQIVLPMSLVVRRSCGSAAEAGA